MISHPDLMTLFCVSLLVGCGEGRVLTYHVSGAVLSIMDHRSERALLNFRLTTTNADGSSTLKLTVTARNPSEYSNSKKLNGGIPHHLSESLTQYTWLPTRISKLPLTAATPY